MLNASSLGSKVRLQVLLLKTWCCRASFLCNLFPFGPVTPPVLLHGSTIDRAKQGKSSHHQVGGTVLWALRWEGGFDLPLTSKEINIYIICRGSDDLVISWKVSILATSLNGVARSCALAIILQVSENLQDFQKALGSSWGPCCASPPFSCYLSDSPAEITATTSCLKCQQVKYQLIKEEQMSVWSCLYSYGVRGISPRLRCRTG